PARICNTPHSKVAASRYSSPCSRTRVTMSSAMAPVAAEIMPGRPPVKAITTAIQNEAYSPTLGSTPAMMEKAMASGISARATTSPDNRSPRVLENQFCLIVCSMEYPEVQEGRTGKRPATFKGLQTLTQAAENCRAGGLLVAQGQAAGQQYKDAAGKAVDHPLGALGALQPVTDLSGSPGDQGEDHQRADHEHQPQLHDLQGHGTQGRIGKLR